MLDTNVLLDWLLDRDPARTIVIDKLFERTKVMHVPDAVIVELAFALEKFYKLPRSTVINNLHKVIDEPAINCNQTLFQRAIADYEQQPAWSFLDACLLQYGELQNALPIWTFDQKLVRQSAGRAQQPA